EDEACDLDHLLSQAHSGNYAANLLAYLRFRASGESSGFSTSAMAKKQPFSLVFAPAVKTHLKVIEAKWDSLIEEKIEEQLTYEPYVETKNRKPLRRRPAPFGAEWEIRFGQDNRFRVLYKIVDEDHEVHILAIGVKQGNRLLVGGKEMDL